jgi:hypothetical protein
MNEYLKTNTVCYYCKVSCSYRLIIVFVVHGDKEITYSGKQR